MSVETGLRGRVVLVTKDRLPESNSQYAQGGNASVCDDPRGRPA